MSSRLLGFVFELLIHHGADPRKLSADLETIAGDEMPAWVSWSDYIAMIHRLGDIAGGAAGVAATMRSVTKGAYSDLRAVAGFFAGPIPFFSFVTHHLNRELVPSASGLTETLSENRVRVRYTIGTDVTPSLLYLQGTVSLCELFPTHFELPEAQVQVRSIDERSCELDITFPQQQPKVRWGAYLTPDAVSASSLTKREQEVLRLVCDGLTNAEIANVLGTAASTVKTQISSILGKMDVANRTELATLAARRP